MLLEQFVIFLFYFFYYVTHWLHLISLEEPLPSLGSNPGHFYFVNSQHKEQKWSCKSCFGISTSSNFKHHLMRSK